MPDPATSGRSPAGSGRADDEQQIILKAQGGDRGAFRCLVERYMKDAYNVAYSFVSDHHSAEEIAQEAFVRAYRSLGSFRGDAGFGTWLYRIVSNLALNRLKQTARRRKHEVLSLPENVVAAHDGIQLLHRSELTGLVERALHELPTMQRAVVILRHIDGLSTKQVSRILGCTEGTVKTHLYRGLGHLREKLEHLRDE